MKESELDPVYAPMSDDELGAWYDALDANKHEESYMHIMPATLGRLLARLRAAEGRSEMSTPQEKAKALMVEVNAVWTPSGLSARQLGEALYTLNEGHGHHDDVTVSVEQCMVCWRLVEYLGRVKVLKDEFRL